MSIFPSSTWILCLSRLQLKMHQPYTIRVGEGFSSGRAKSGKCFVGRILKRSVSSYQQYNLVESNAIAWRMTNS